MSKLKAQIDLLDTIINAIEPLRATKKLHVFTLDLVLKTLRDFKENLLEEYSYEL